MADSEVMIRAVIPSRTEILIVMETVVAKFQVKLEMNLLKDDIR